MANVGIIGTGWGTRVQVPLFREAGLNVQAIAGADPARTTRIAAELGLRAHERWQDLVSAPDIDLVSIVTPPSEHHAMALAALEHGKHVLCEKPTAMSVREAQELVAAADQHPAQLALIDHELRFLPSWREARPRVNEWIGTTRHVEVRYASPSRGDRTRAWNWWSDATQGGGIWGAVGSHFVDALRYFGFEVEAVQGLLSTRIASRPFGDAEREVTADDFASVQLRLHDGGIAVMNFSAVTSGPDETSMLTIYGERGALRITGEEVLLSTDGKPFATVSGGPMATRPGNSPGGAFGTGTLYLGRALREALDEGNLAALAPAATFRDGLEQQRVLDAARLSSARGGGWISL